MRAETSAEALRLNLQARLGARLQLGDTTWILIEVLAKPPSIVLQADQQRSIQPNRHGDSHRRVPRTRSVPISLESPEIMALLELPAP